MSNNEINFDQSGATNIQNAVGDGIEMGGINVGSQHQGVSELKTLFESLSQSLEGKSFPSNAPQEVVIRFENPAAMVAAAEREVAIELKAEKPSPQGWKGWFMSILPLVADVSFDVGAAVVDSLAEKSTVVTGLKALVHSVQEHRKSEG